MSAEAALWVFAAALVTGAVALIMQKFVPGYWYVFTGALAGSIAGGFIDESE